MVEENAFLPYYSKSGVYFGYSIPKYVEDETLEVSRRRSMWENDDYICRAHILNGTYDTLFDVYQNVEYIKEL